MAEQRKRFRTAEQVARRKTSPLPVSIPRDRLAYVLRKHDKDLQLALTGVSSRYVASRDVIEVVFTFDPRKYLSVTESGRRRR